MRARAQNRGEINRVKKEKTEEDSEPKHLGFMVKLLFMQRYSIFCIVLMKRLLV